MTPTDQDPETTGHRHDHPVRDAFDRATRWFGNLLAPLVIITYTKDAQQAFDYLIERPLLTGSFVLIFIVILLYNVLRTVNIQLSGWPRWRKRPSEPQPPTADTAEPRPADVPVTSSRGRTLLRVSAIVGSLLALVLLVYAYVLVFVTGLHFVAIASAPDKASAIAEIQTLNRFFEDNGYSDLEARAHASTATGTGWYMISVGGPHTSRDAAETTFERAKKAMGMKMRTDAYIYSTKNASPTRVIRNWIRGILKRIFG